MNAKFEFHNRGVTQMTYNFRQIISATVSGAVAAVMMVAGSATPSLAHIDLKSPEPLLNGHAGNMRALKDAPFGAKRIDVAAAPATTVQAGSVIELDVEHYVYHPGTVVVLYTIDPSGADVMPAYSIPEDGAAIPHTNLLAEFPVPPRGTKRQTYRVTLPDIEGTIILVVRQVMHDKFDKMPDGSVSLKRVYYHQAAKLELVK